MERIIFATGNEGKMREIREILSDVDREIISMKEAEITADILEDGATFEENAIIKAKAVAALTNDIVLADDSGLEVDYLNKEPGVYSARYMGEDTSYEIKNKAILERLSAPIAIIYVLLFFRATSIILSTASLFSLYPLQI